MPWENRGAHGLVLLDCGLTIFPYVRDNRWLKPPNQVAFIVNLIVCVVL